jgi:hypothetical protein
MKTGQDVYLRLPRARFPRAAVEQEPLHRALVVGTSEEHWTVALEACDVELQAGCTVLVFYTGERRFLQQAASVAAVDTSASSCILDLAMLGDPIPSEQREHLRTSALGAEATVQVVGDLACRVQDVSLSGFSIATVERYQVDEVLTIELVFAERVATGRAAVQNVRKLWGHRLRYGLRCAEAGELMDALRDLSAETQRIQLRRLRGN